MDGINYSIVHTLRTAYGDLVLYGMISQQCYFAKQLLFVVLTRAYGQWSVHNVWIVVCDPVGANVNKQNYKIVQHGL